MPDLPAVTGNQAIRAFERFGFAVSRINGSHHVMTKPGHRFILSIPVHGNDNLKPGTLRSLIKAAGIRVEEFCEALDR